MPRVIATLSDDLYQYVHEEASRTRHSVSLIIQDAVLAYVTARKSASQIFTPHQPDSNIPTDEELAPELDKLFGKS